MKTTVVQLEEKHLDKVVSSLQSHSRFKKLSPTSKYEVLRGTIGNETIIIYSSGKVVMNGEESVDILKNILATIEDFPTSEIVIGSDEAGKGELLGPICVAAVALTPEEALVLRTKGVMDSKDLSILKIRKLATLLVERSEVAKVVNIYPRKFNSLFNEFKDEEKTLNDLLAWGHATAIQDVYERIVKNETAKSIKIIVDEFDRIATTERIRRVMSLEGVQLEQKPRAESETAVAAASILARNAREIWIDKESSRLDIDLRKLTSDELFQLPSYESIVKKSYYRRD